MGVIEDVLKALDRIPLWKRLGQVPDEVDDLKKRVAELEEKLSGKWPPDVCRKCGERALRLQHVLGPTTKGMMQENWTCEACGFQERRQIAPKR